MLKIKIKFYDKKQEDLFKQWPQFSRIESLVNFGLEVDELELLTYSIFDEQRDNGGWRSFADMKQRVPSRIDMFKDYFDLSRGTITSRVTTTNSYNSLTEKVGVATSLVAANRIFDLHEADWTKIPITNKSKTLDFMHASTGASFVEVEAKGSIVDNSEEKSNSIYQHKLGISKKKETRKQAGPPGFLLGGIAAIPSDPTNEAVCWLVDPPAQNPEVDPFKFKLIARMRFYLDVISPLSQSSLLTALRNRIDAISAVSNLRELDNIPLVNFRGGRFRFSGAFFRNKTTIERRVTGKVFPIAPREFIFVGLDSEALRVISRQRFDEVAAYKSSLSDTASIIRRTTAWLEEQDLSGQSPEELGAEWVPQKKRFRLELEGPTRIGRSGRAIGLLAPINDRTESLLVSGRPPKESSQQTKLFSPGHSRLVPSPSRLTDKT